MKFSWHPYSNHCWEIPKDPSLGMRVPGRFYADEELLKNIVQDESLQQVINAACLPGILKASLAMPDIHYGYGLPIGGVVGTDIEADGVITPGGVGFDINCGVRLITTELPFEKVKPQLKELASFLYAKIPAGVGSKGNIKLSTSEIKNVLKKGSKWAVERNYGDPIDLQYTEENGSLAGADPALVSDKAYQRGQNQLGTLGSGNHFLEVQKVENIFDSQIAEAFNLKKNHIAVMIHSGSRGFGHQVCTDSLGIMTRSLKKYEIEVPDKQLACAPFKSKEAQDYLAAMACAANYAWANRQILMYLVMKAFLEFFSISKNELGWRLLYDVAHNIVKVEEHLVDGKKKKIALHRKGATRAFGPGHTDLPEKIRSLGQPVIVPGDMGTASYVLVGTEKAMQDTFGSTCHGAGRVLSRNAALKAAQGRALTRELEDAGIYVKSAGKHTIAEEMPEAYKNIEQVVKIVHESGISTKVARLEPLVVIKG